MPKATWGAMDLHAQGVNHMGGGEILAEKPLLPAPGATGPQTVLQGGGRKRRRVQVSGWLNSGDYMDLRDDYELQTPRQLVIAGEVNMTALVLEVSGQRRPGWSKATYQATFIEV